MVQLSKFGTNAEEEVNDDLKRSQDILAKQEEYLRRLGDLNHRLIMFRDNLMPCCTEEEGSDASPEKGSTPEENFEDRMNHFLEQERRYLESLETTIAHLEQFA